MSKVIKTKPLETKQVEKEHLGFVEVEEQLPLVPNYEINNLKCGVINGKEIARYKFTVNDTRPIQFVFPLLFCPDLSSSVISFENNTFTLKVVNNTENDIEFSICYICFF